MKPGRRRKYPSNAAKQTAYRMRRDAPMRQKLIAKILKQMGQRSGARAENFTGMTTRQLKYWARFTATKRHIS